MDARQALATAIDRVGSQRALGEALGGYTQNAIHQAQKVGRVSPAMARRLDEWSNGEFSKHDLRPDIFGPAPEGAAPGEAA